eukprot:gene12720-15964_t
MADDLEMVDYIQKLLGYAISGEKKEEIFVILSGTAISQLLTATAIVRFLFFATMIRSTSVARGSFTGAPAPAPAQPAPSHSHSHSSSSSTCYNSTCNTSPCGAGPLTHPHHNPMGPTDDQYVSAWMHYHGTTVCANLIEPLRIRLHGSRPPYDTRGATDTQNALSWMRVHGTSNGCPSVSALFVALLSVACVAAVNFHPLPDHCWQGLLEPPEHVQPLHIDDSQSIQGLQPLHEPSPQELACAAVRMKRLIARKRACPPPPMNYASSSPGADADTALLVVSVNSPPVYPLTVPVLAPRPTKPRKRVPPSARELRIKTECEAKWGNFYFY